ncbi:MAG: AbrB/MazE/SpoVT family DNA-binding domain-containing protein [Xenococcus sp. (in: cyanobacteria)]
MKVELKKWGNSLGLRIPAKIAQSIGLDENSTVELIQSGESLIIKKKEVIDLDELLSSIPDDFEYPEDVRDFVESERKGEELI